MKTFLAKYEKHLKSNGYEITKTGDVWNLISDDDLLLENRSKGDLLLEAYNYLGD